MIIKSGRAKYAWTTFISMAFMFLATFTASWDLVNSFCAKASLAAITAEGITYKVDAAIVFLMALLAVIILVDMVYTWFLYFAVSSRLSTDKTI